MYIRDYNTPPPPPPPHTHTHTHTQTGTHTHTHAHTQSNYDVSIVALPTGPTCARNLVKAKCKMNIILVTDMNRRKVKI
jgi:hypothetical protein